MKKGRACGKMQVRPFSITAPVMEVRVCFAAGDGFPYGEHSGRRSYQSKEGCSRWMKPTDMWAPGREAASSAS